MKFNIGALVFDLDLTQLLNGNGLGLHINGEIRPGLNLSVEVSYLPVSIEKLKIDIMVKEVGEFAP